MNKNNMRGRLLASTMIAGAAFIALGVSAAHAADATDASGPIATSSGSGAPYAPTTGVAVSKIDAATDATAADTVQDVVVTGSRIPTPNLTSVAPIQSVNHEQFQLEGHSDVIDLLNELPANFQNSVSDFSNTTNPLTAPGGVSTADLRGLGPQRTLVLVNGRRLGVGDPNTGDTNPAPDLDQIPVALIDHVEVVTGGASATYGSDAVAGVVNFVMKHDFEGVQLDGTFGEDEHDQHNPFMQGIERAAGITPPTGSVWDGQNTDFSVIMGANAPDGRGNVTGYFEFKHTSPITEGSRDFSDCLYSSAVVAAAIGDAPNNECTGSVNSNEYLPQTGPNAGIADLTVVGHSFLPFPQAGSSPPGAFNSSPYEYLSRDDNRYLAGFFAHYDIADWAKPYAEFSFMSDASFSATAPSGAFEGSGPDFGGGWSINCNNPLMSAQQQTALCGAEAGTSNLVSTIIGRRDIEGGPRTSTFDHTNFRIVVGMKGDFADAWHYDAYGSYYSTDLALADGGYFSISGIENALDVTGTAANPVCASGAAGCIPWNIFTQGGVTAAQVASLEKSGTSHGQTVENIWEGDLTGDLGKYGWKLPWATDGLGVSVGFQHRWDQLTFAPDAAELSGDLSGFGGASAAVDNAISVQEEYGEVRIPIAQRQPFAEDLNLEGGVRYSEYSTSGGVVTYKVGGEWAPTQDIRFRASYDRAIRAASIIEAFSPDVITTTSVVSSDPCAATANAAASASFAQCARTGVTMAEYGNGISPANGGTDIIVQCPGGQCSSEEGGNTALKPEISDSYSVGFTATPRFLRGFTGSIDYWDIKIAGEINNIPQSVSLQNCLNNIDASTFCPLVVRTDAGDLFGTTIPGKGYIIAIDSNLAATDTSGIDFQADYHLNFEDMGMGPWGSLAFHLVGTYQVTNKTQTLSSEPTYDCAGLFGPTCQNVDPKWRHTFSLTWNTPWNVLARLQWRYIGGSSLDNNANQPVLFEGFLGEVDPDDAKLPAVNYLDLSGAWRINSALTLRGGINNILDQDPPLISQVISGTGTPNGYPTYDLLGREFFISGTAKF